MASSWLIPTRSQKGIYIPKPLLKAFPSPDFLGQREATSFVTAISRIAAKTWPGCFPHVPTLHTIVYIVEEGTFDGDLATSFAARSISLEVTWDHRKEKEDIHATSSH